MKKTLILVFAGFVFSNANAQQFSGGLRTGLSMWMDKEEGKCFTNSGSNNKTWDKEAFIRYNTKGKLAFEASMGHYALNTRYAQPDGPYPAIAEQQYYVAAERSQNVEWNLSAQYNISCPALKEKCPLMSNLESYFGSVLTPTLTRNTTELRAINDFENNKRTSTTDSWAVWTGLTHTLVYSLCEHMYITSAVRLQMDPDKFFEDEGAIKSRDTRLGLQIGVGYNFR